MMCVLYFFVAVITFWGSKHFSNFAKILILKFKNYFVYKNLKNVQYLAKN